jgi:hypothetical protein
VVHFQADFVDLFHATLLIDLVKADHSLREVCLYILEGGLRCLTFGPRPGSWRPGHFLLLNGSLLELRFAYVLDLHQIDIFWVAQSHVFGDVALHIIILIVLRIVSEESSVVVFVTF